MGALPLARCAQYGTKMAANMLLKIIVDEFDDAIDYTYFEALEQLNCNNISTLSTAASASVLTRNTTFIENYYETTVPLYSPTTFASHFRMSREIMQAIYRSQTNIFSSNHRHM